MRIGRTLEYLGGGIVAIITALIFLGWLFIMMTSPAAAQATCNHRTIVTNNLVQKYNEQHMGGGLGGSRVFEIWVNEETGTWTILRSSPDGQSCVMAVGDGWTSTGFKEIKPGKDS